jgi:hypothetical protein
LCFQAPPTRPDWSGKQPDVENAVVEAGEDGDGRVELLDVAPASRACEEAHCGTKVFIGQKQFLHGGVYSRLIGSISSMSDVGAHLSRSAKSRIWLIASFNRFRLEALRII